MNIWKKAARLISYICLLVFIVSCVMIGRALLATHKQTSMTKELVETRTASIESEDKDWSHGMLALNKDYAGWLTVYGTPINYPTVYTGDNDTYLRMDFEGNWAVGGTLFLDEECDITEDGNRLIYGHHMLDNTMFCCLSNFKDEDFFRENRFIYYEEETGAYYYKIIGVMVTPASSDYSNYVSIKSLTNTPTDEEMREFLGIMEERAAIYQKTVHRTGDRYIFLMTCDYSRYNGNLLLVVGKRLVKNNDGIYDDMYSKVTG